jgi:hypothetical protein
MAKNPRNNDDDDEVETKRGTKEVGVEPQAITPGTWPSPIDGWRAAVAGVAVTVVNPAAGDALLPYPTGTPLAPGSKFWLTNGYYKSAVPT